MKIADLKVGETYVHVSSGSYTYVRGTYRLLSTEMFAQSKALLPKPGPVTLPDGTVVEVVRAMDPGPGRRGTHVVVETISGYGGRYTLLTPSSLTMTLTEWEESKARNEAAQREAAERRAEQNRGLNQRFGAALKALDLSPVTGTDLTLRSSGSDGTVTMTLDMFEQIAAKVAANHSKESTT